jgi:hypothetical protein
VILCGVNAERQELRSYCIEQIQVETIPNRGFLSLSTELL